MLNYTKLWIQLSERGMKKTDLLEVISAPVLAKLSKNKNVNTESIAKICDFLECQPGDIMENITRADIEKINDVMNEQFSKFFEQLEKQTGVSRKTMIELYGDMLKDAPGLDKVIMGEKADLLEIEKHMGKKSDKE